MLALTLMCAGVCFISSILGTSLHFGTSGCTHQPGSHRRMVIENFVSYNLLRFLP